MVERRTLTPLVLVRIQVPQPKISSRKSMQHGFANNTFKNYTFFILRQHSKNLIKSLIRFLQTFANLVSHFFHAVA